MRKIVNREIQEYLSIVDEYYSSEAFPNDQNLDREKVTSLLSEKLKSAWHDADMAADTWSNLVLGIRSKPWVKFARNWEKACSLHTYKLIVGIRRDNGDWPCSVVLFLSFIGKQIGMLYVDMLAENNHRPFHEHSRTPGNSVPIPFASYSPLNKSHEEHYMEILEEVNRFFPEFTFFENRFADYKVKGVQTEDDYFTDIDLFMIFFERGLPAGVPT